FIASGGVSSVEDLKKLAETGVYGAILGRALYEGWLTVAQALEAVR
ncbi:MAG: 1-(5-phosphoribosyl)-5-((5-phosphoribosylamino)methylideneamino)imidazole-4-carboxamide isomerase, partial [Clostridia bacterium]|nr:1-(5-phosphoribosyl)-5-((5-phosphoribosylamino)methylideneamino)imidazole-4-carboxamide isomerase [Clostridia bacterium]